MNTRKMTWTKTKQNKKRDKVLKSKKQKTKTCEITLHGKVLETQKHSSSEAILQKRCDLREDGIKTDDTALTKLEGERGRYLAKKVFIEISHS